jgi:DNA-binding response OmpR family regulator
MNILIIEDCKNLNDLWAGQARKRKHKVEQAFDMLDAILALKNGKFDLIFCDIDLGTGRNHGPKALLQSELHGARIVFMTAQTEDEYAENIQPVIDAGYDVECLRKPLEVKRFLELLK